MLIRIDLKIVFAENDEKWIMKRRHFDWEMNCRPNVADGVASDRLLIFPFNFDLLTVPVTLTNQYYHFLIYNEYINVCVY